MKEEKLMAEKNKAPLSVDDIIVAKFGGSSLSDGEHFKKVKEIVLSDSRIRYVVPSAPGKRFSKDEKVTDMLYECYSLSSKGESIEEIFSSVTDRYNSIISDLSLDLDLTEEYTHIKWAIMHHAGRDYAASRGEYLNGIILAAFLGFDFIDPAPFIKFADDGVFEGEITDSLLYAELKKHEHAVIPGFYGSMPNGTIKTFSRGGSDITGSIVARAVMASIYQNWTDVDGFLMADPRIIDNPRTISTITYKELRELSYMGAGVLHEDSIFPVRVAGIPIIIKNTNHPDAKGTLIISDLNAPESPSVITGIAGKKGFSVISIEKAMMNSETGFGRRVLEAIEKEEVNFEHLPSGIDTMSVILSTDEIADKRDRILDRICSTVEPDSITIEDGLALIAVVGRGMVKAKGTASRVFKATAEADINIKMIDQGSSELNIIIGVDETDFVSAMNAIYKEFEK